MTHTRATTEQIPDDAPVIEVVDPDDDTAGDEPCNCGGAWHAVRDHCRNWTCPGCDRTDLDCPLMLT
jgi:hypothetical protein